MTRPQSVWCALMLSFRRKNQRYLPQRARRNARDAIGLFSQNSNWGPNNLARLSRQRRLHRCQVFRVSRTTGTSSHEVDVRDICADSHRRVLNMKCFPQEMLTALTYWQESQRARENVCVYTDILSLATKSVVVCTSTFSSASVF